MKVGYGTLSISILIGIIWVGAFIGLLIKKPNVLVKETSEYLYYKEYEIYNLDSAIYKYHKPIIYNGTIVKRYTTSHFVGVAGKGGHYQKNYHLIVSYGNKHYEETSSSMYNRFYLGEDVKVVETFYPRYKVDIIKIKNI